MKTVKYKGQLFSVPDYAKFIASDADGAVWVYNEYPDTEYSRDRYIRSTFRTEAKKVGNLAPSRGKVKEIK